MKKKTKQRTDNREKGAHDTILRVNTTKQKTMGGR